MIIDWFIERWCIKSNDERFIYNYFKRMYMLMKNDDVDYIDYENSIVVIKFNHQIIRIQSRCISMTNTQIFDVKIDDNEVPYMNSVNHIIRKIYNYSRRYYNTRQKKLQLQTIADIIKFRKYRK